MSTTSSSVLYSSFSVTKLVEAQSQESFLQFRVTRLRLFFISNSQTGCWREPYFSFFFFCPSDFGIIGLNLCLVFFLESGKEEKKILPFQVQEVEVQKRTTPSNASLSTMPVQRPFFLPLLFTLCFFFLYLGVSMLRSRFYDLITYHTTISGDRKNT